MSRFGRRACAACSALALLLIAACDDHSADHPLAPGRSSASQLPSDRAALEAQINALINALYAPKDQGAIFREFAQIKGLMASGNTVDAQTELVAFFRRVLGDLSAGGLQDPNGSQPPTTADAVRDLLRYTAAFGGVTAPLPESSADGAIGVIGPAGGTLVSSSGFGGVSFPAGALPADVIVVVNRLPNPTQPKTGPLPTTLDQYPLFYDFSTIPQVQTFAQPVTVGLCQLEVGEPFGPATQGIADRLQVAHPDPANPSTVQLLARTTANFIHCDGVSLASAASRNPGTGLAARALNAIGRIGGSVAALFRPTPAYAIHGGLGGLTSSFSPFGAVDPGVSIVGVCSTPMTGVTTTYPTIDQAIASVPPGAVIRVCPQTITLTSTVFVTKPVTIVASDVSNPPRFIVPSTISGGTGFNAGTGFVVQPTVQGSVTFRSLAFTLTTTPQALLVSAIDLGTGQGPGFPGSWWQVTVEQSTFTMPPGLGRAVRAFQTSYAHPKLLFRANQTTGGLFPVVTLTGSSTSDIEIFANSFGPGVGTAAVLLQNEAFARVANNLFTSCGTSAHCVRLDRVATGVVTSNTISIPSTSVTSAGIAVMNSGSATVTNNSILGGGITGAATDTLSYRFRDAAILVGTSAGTTVTDPTGVGSASANVSSNIINSAAVGVRVAGGGLSITGSNNTISQTHTIARLDDATSTPSSLSITGSDFTTFITAIRFAWPVNAPGTIAMQCNWWGTAAGPLAFAAGVPSSMYEPFATGPVANGAGGQCNGTNP